MQNYLDKKIVAETLGISIVSVDRLRKSGKLPYRQVGGLVKFLPQDLEIFSKRSFVGGHDENPCWNYQRI